MGKSRAESPTPDLVALSNAANALESNHTNINSDDGNDGHHESYGVGDTGEGLSSLSDSTKGAPESTGQHVTRGKDTALYDDVLREMTKLSLRDDTCDQENPICVTESHQSKSDRLLRKLRSVDDVQYGKIVEPLPVAGEPGFDLWDLKSRAKSYEQKRTHVESLFKNDSPERWLNLEKLGNADDTLSLLRRGSPCEVLADRFGIEMTRKHLRCLDGPRWLNDEVINFYIGLIQERNDRLTGDGVAGIPRCLCFNTFFFNLLCGGDDPTTTYNYSAVSRWTTRRKVDVFAIDLLLIPIHVHNSHWCLGVVDMRPRSRRIMVFDSLSGHHRLFFRNMSRWLQDEHLNKKKVPIEDIDEWKHNHIYAAEGGAPRQNNGHDCGVFLCLYAECISVGKPFDFSQNDIRDRRVMMIQQILRGSIYE
ncbi:ulp1 protease family, C-terminal catalytic domain containing protein, putative [Babesia bigemina]|uniref:Ulp1 protease family, C-terminal catalytic domain containing protein, putative n=1 Tax=Babesia bigemina TaxID=5866 RepID=A0A061D3X5_BABBI|nr:ulp1 protease family, C-terminal catalytic domain containing protein, putative [Babesia bigemina]CDR95268.1 ulp1 protease family, C-terminal catalytic domain containing protein, putative [Babesia bigemina]|eukprot:XP_012767454.1 ulp1 protease family, C-terminal catalytic domain containing protein, putative [Babesia bigemina]